MEICIGDYYRTKKGLISKVKTINTPETRKQKHLGYTKRNVLLVNGRYTLNDIKSYSKNKIDLVECSDYVNGERIHTITTDKHLLTERNENILDKYRDIKSIVTKEQYKSVEYVF